MEKMRIAIFTDRCTEVVQRQSTAAREDRILERETILNRNSTRRNVARGRKNTRGE